MSPVLIAVLVWIIIQSSDQACEDGNIRLSGGRHYREGRVEVCRNQQWGRVCDDEWDENDAAVACRQLGLSEEGAEAINEMQSVPDWYGPSFFALDDVGCNGSESNLLDCLPKHNCGMNRGVENAGVQCLRKGVRVEYGPNQESNNTLITVNGTQEDNATLFCSTDRENCCIDEFNVPGSWFLPNRTKISANYTQSLHNDIALGSQTVGLNISPDLPSGIYHCEMMDRHNITHHLYAGIYPENEVCRDLELRINNKCDIHKSAMEMCIDDRWHEVKRSMLVVNNSQSLQDIPVMIVDSTSESVMLEWSGQPNDKNISGYDLSCTASSDSDHGQIHEVRVSNISTSTTRVQVSGLLPGMAYQCCVNAHIQTNTPFDLINSNCVATSTKAVHNIEPIIANGLIIGLGVGLGVCSLLLLVSILKISKTMSCTSCLKHDSITHGNIIRVTEEYDLVANPIYNISMQCTPQRGMITASTTVATTTRSRGDAAAIAYKELPSNIRGNKPSIPITASQLATDV